VVGHFLQVDNIAYSLLISYSLLTLKSAEYAGVSPVVAAITSSRKNYQLLLPIDYETRNKLYGLKFEYKGVLVFLTRHIF
jgi:hypothetical protein